MPIHLINLRRSPERKAAMCSQLESLRLRYEIFVAVDGGAGEHLPFPNYHDAYCLKGWQRPLTPGEVGCFASHYLLWRRCVERDEPMIVMEDDVEISPRLIDALPLLPRLADLGYVRLAGIDKVGFNPLSHQLPAGWQLVRFLAEPLGTQCYALFPAAAERLLRSAERWTLPVDHYIDSFWRHGVPCLGLVPFPVALSSRFASTIWSGALSPSMQMRDRVWRPKRFVARKARDLRRHWANLEYATGLREVARCF